MREDTVYRPDGDQSTYAVVTMGDGVAVVPLTDDGRVFLVREYKHGLRTFSLEIPCGSVEKGEPPVEAARRELKEETGLLAEKMISLGAVHSYTSLIQGVEHLFVARGLKEVEPEPDEGEFIDRLTLPFAQVLEMVLNGEITDAPTCVAILKLAQRRL